MLLAFFWRLPWTYQKRFSVSMETSPSNTPVWDSFAQMSLVLNTETEFNIVLEYEEIFEIVSVKSLIELIERKVQE